MRRLMDLWQRITHRQETAPEPPPVRLERDPALDALHREQHDLINDLTRKHLRDQWNERVRESWRPIRESR